MNVTLIVNGTVYAPEVLGSQSILLVGSKIAKIGPLDAEALESAGLPCEVLDADGSLIVPGMIDPHAHLIGAGGESGFASRMPEIMLEQLICAGITTVVGLLGTDTVTREPRCLFAKAHQLSDEGLTAYMYTGGFELPPRTITDSALDDVTIVDCVIGTGEVALSDPRWVDPPLEDLAHLVAQTALGGKMAGKAGVTHFHIGPGENRLALLRDLLDSYEIEPESIYVTHITRSEALMEEAIALAKRGVYVDMDAVEQNIGDCLRYYLAHDGPPERLTVSSDAHTPGGSPAKFFQQFVSCVREHEYAVETALPFFGSNAAKALKLSGKGQIQEGFDADLLILNEKTLSIEHIFAQGRQFVKNGERIVKSQQEQQLEESLP